VYAMCSTFECDTDYARIWVVESAPSGLEAILVLIERESRSRNAVSAYSRSDSFPVTRVANAPYWPLP
jgi:hypothetical protein